MKNFSCQPVISTYAALASLLVAISAMAGENSAQQFSTENTSEASTFSLSGEYVIEGTYVGNGEVRRRLSRGDFGQDLGRSGRASGRR